MGGGEMSSIVEKMSSGLDIAATEIMLLRECLEFQQQESRKFREALERIALCDWPGPLPLKLSRADWLQEIAKEALK
jgi:hypothetical protein